MLTRLFITIAVSVFSVVGLGSYASASDHPIPTTLSLLKWGGVPRVGKQYKITSKPAPNVALPECGTGVEPADLGGSVTVSVGGKTLECDLQAAPWGTSGGGWKGLGTCVGGVNKGYKYLNKEYSVLNPCKVITLKGNVIQILAKGVGDIPWPPSSSPAEYPAVAMSFTAGQETYCALALPPHSLVKVGTFIKDISKPAPPDCELPPTTTTTLPPTTTTTLAPTTTTTLAPTTTTTLAPTTTTTTTTSTTTTTTTVPHFVDNGDGTITDNHTGLMWEKKSADLSVHDYTNQYTWCQPPPDCILDNGTVFTQFLKKLNDKCDGNEIKSCTDDSDCMGIGSGLCGYAGYRDWRLPEVGRDGAAAELDSLLDLSQGSPPYTFDAFNSSCITDCTVLDCSCTYPSYTWSHTDYAFDPTDWDVWVVNFGSGYVNPDGKDAGLFARAVRGVPFPTTTTTTTLGGTTTTTLPRFVDNGDGTITDDLTALMWEKKDQSLGLHDYRQQYSWCSQPPLDCYLPDGQVFEDFLLRMNNMCDGNEITFCTDDSGCTGIGNGLCGHAGYRDWRLPEIDRDAGTEELDSLLDLSQGGPPYIFAEFNSSCITDCTVLTCSCPSPHFTWSNTLYAFPPPGQLDVWVANFGDGYVVPRGKNDTGYVRAVRP